jgi:hypothetical protein
MTRNVEKLNCIVLYSNKISLGKLETQHNKNGWILWMNISVYRFAPPVGHVLELDTLLAT